MMKFLNLVCHLIRTLKYISLFLVLIFGCVLAQNQSVGSYFAMLLLVGFCFSVLMTDINFFSIIKQNLPFNPY